MEAWLAVSLLGPTDAPLGVKVLEESRSHSVQDADARLAQIERDLHDGTQAQFVAIAMKPGDANDRLAGEAVPESIRTLLARAGQGNRCADRPARSGPRDPAGGHQRRTGHGT